MKCKHCGLGPEDHHEFEAAMPPGCVCDPGTWGAGVWDEIDVPPACGAFVGETGQFCRHCQHDEGCHKPKDPHPEVRS